ncbi:hypothetical protein GCM10008956_22820 [Deinococcus arenae]|uniref:Uncharacterized protein n=1 Tax=Deinococcus arenae TaxID=1452751 RepID=A0A8H9GSZ0_9DEIO|nr:winged helix-turn-helix domain-containing protein [Deinococcus arenae]AWT35013.1 hypothetical protein DM785_05160 [Deinococcus actinosclerus]GGM46093.1 hypothetical protein GCM10008956_22820 [Deinococcus arenae]
MGDLPSLTVSTPGQARLLLDPALLSPLGYLLRGEVSAAELARACGLSVQQAHHRLTRLRAAGLVVVTQEQARAGRPVKRYRAAAQAFRVPFALTDHATLSELVAGLHRDPLAQQHERVGRMLAAQPGRHLNIHLNARGQVTLDFDGFEDVLDSVISAHRLVHLSPADAQELETRLQALFDWLDARAQSRAEGLVPRLLGVFLTPGDG